MVFIDQYGTDLTKNPYNMANQELSRVTREIKGTQTEELVPTAPTDIVKKQIYIDKHNTKEHNCRYCKNKSMLKVELGNLFGLVAEYEKHIDDDGDLNVYTYRQFKLALRTKAKQLKQFHLKKP